jgi:hypothetical protein
MKQTLRKCLCGENTARNAWIAFGSLLALALVAMTVRELPSMRREWRLMRM